MTESEIDYFAEWAAEHLCKIFRQTGQNIDELGTAVLYMFVRKLLIDYWIHNKTEFANDEMFNLCFALCKSVPTQTKAETIAACEIFLRSYLPCIKQFDERRHQKTQQILEEIKKNAVFVNAEDLEFDEEEKS